jgi:hypothetical protein
VAVVLDTSVLVASFDRDEPDHAVVRAWLATSDEDLVTTPLAVAEMDHMIRVRGGETAQQQLWADLEAGAVTVRWWADGIRDTVGVARRHPWIGLTDASLIALTRIARTDRIATLDTHFRSLTTPDGQALTLLPE